MAQRAGVELNARRFLTNRVTGKMGIGMLIGVQPVNREEARLGQHAVVAAHRMAFRLDVDIALVISKALRRDVQNAEIERGEQFNLRQVGAGVPTRRAVGVQSDDMATYGAGFALECLDIIAIGIHLIPLNLFSTWNIYSVRD